ncbi:ABC transporter ATP-binding protein [Streptomyces griseoviridis]|uniref:Multidrug ABC transporter ATP-binding protein n=3 Tax=Streptomyces TaxID=1883 RepID=A0A918GVV0_STRGD|nr:MULTISPECIES: ABC transporter ATP-binding protein [Streptomyces]MDP9680371.1 ATP-binding cassette subfamily B protein [Streptomyces griseoviridis]GGS67404.1 multidrug ABC transporter ATP-binding protein [Streptomyces niveoruber]GGT16546.1 multidrug ABC transporter ATP-binding protein [Streptomyces griseoviridis]GGU62911.1 multidrug ABC transporter ATP-binding protein [Streptomyces daghestanicus]GHI29107.1 multidrug ABC transporter ATP-binding protein [Streptomyces daghestanicus]
MKPEHDISWTPPADAREQPRQVRRILRLFRPYRGRLAVVGALVGAASLVSVATPFLIREILDVAIPEGRTGLLSLLALGMILGAVLTSVFGVLQTLISTTVGQRVMHDLRTAVYGRLQRMSLAFFTRTRTGEVQSRIANDIGGMQATVTSTATSLVSNATSVIATVVAMIALDWRLTVVSLLLLPVFVWVSRRVGNERKKITTQRQKQMAAMAATVTESLSVSGILLGRTMGRSDSLTRSFAGESERLVDLEVRSNMAGRWRMAVITIVMAALPAVIYWTAGLALQLGGPDVSIGTIVAFVSLQQGLFRPAVSLLSTGVQIQTSLALFQRIFEYLDLPLDITERENPVHLDQIKGEVRFENVEFRYDGKGGPVLDGIDITVPAGGGLAVVGPTGAGKSTLGYLVPRLYDVTGGRVTLDGVDVRDLDFDTLTRAVGVVSQETYLFHASVADNLRFAKPDATDEELVEAARAAQIHDHIAALPDGYDTVVGERGHRFSGGEKQRLAIARTILRDPPVLILDEATSALDTRTEAAVQQALDALSADRTTITIAHRLSTVRDADQIAVLDSGHLAERGTHEELLELDGRYAALVRRDARRVPTS